MKTPLGRVLGHGSAHAGTLTFWRQRLTSLLLLPLGIFAVVLVIGMAGSDYETAVATLHHPWVALPLLALLLTAAWHMKIGMQEIIDDYFHAPGLKLAATIGNIGFAVLIAAAAGFAVLRLAFGT